MTEEEKKEVEVVETSQEAATETVEDITAEVATEKPAKKSRGRKKKIETKEEKPASEWSEQVVQISRVTKVVKGGKKLSFRAIVVVGNKKGQVGVGCAKASEVIIAIQKAITDGRKNLITVGIPPVVVNNLKSIFLLNTKCKLNLIVWAIRGTVKLTNNTS